MDNSNISEIDNLEKDRSPSPTSTDFEIISNYEDDIISISSSYENYDESIDESFDEESDSDDENPIELLNDSDFLYSDSDDGNQTIYDGDLPQITIKSTSSEQQRSSDYLVDSNSFGNVQMSGICESHKTNDWCSKCRPNWLPHINFGDDSNIKNLSISQYLFNRQKISHCSSCTPTWFDFKNGFNPVMNNDGLLLAKPVFLKPGSKSLPGSKLNVVGLKNIGLTSSPGETYFSDLSKCKSCLYESGHVLPYYGVTFHPDNLRYMIVMPFLSNRNFREYLKHPDNFKSFTWSRRLSMLHTLAVELTNLHKLGIIHKNLHPNNILIGTDIEDPIISDVGLMPELPYKNSSDEYVVHGVLPYIDPTVMTGSAFSSKSDVYSFAFIMWEVATCSLPYTDLPHDNKLAKKIVEGKRPYIPDHVPSFYAELIRMCWDAFPENRPNMREIAGIFTYWRNKLTISGTNYGNFPKSSEHNTVYKEFQKADEFRLQDEFSSITRFSKLHFDAKFSSSLYKFKFPEKIAVGNLFSHKQSNLSASVRQHIIPDTGPIITPIPDPIHSSPDQFSCNKCDLNLDNKYWWCQTCETSRLRDKFGSWTSGNRFVDQYIQYTQTLAPSRESCLEWIPYSDFNNIKEIGRVFSKS
ncbi:kinase-like protein [Gigaspora margarita]|uniref:Kinase-like protein n=1 Tax=Gigaspora margarita TaxID=4874 RepID=A0A8H4AQD6_GIGMA|nr:kinase-like protein [Gigaspora margarita]